MRRSSRCVAISHSVITSKRARLRWRGNFSPSQFQMAGMVFQKRSYGSRFTLMMMKQPISGIRRLAYQKNAYNDEVWQITFGRWAYLDHVVPVQKFIMTAVLRMEKMVDRLRMKIVTLKSGTLFSCRTCVAMVQVKRTIQFLVNYQRKILILDLV